MKKSILVVAKNLTERTWIPYQYFEAGSSILLLNVSTSEDSLQEYALYKKNPETGEFVKFESLTVSWYKEQELANDLERYESTSFEALTHNNYWSTAKNAFTIPIITSENFARFQADFSKFEVAY